MPCVPEPPGELFVDGTVQEPDRLLDGAARSRHPLFASHQFCSDPVIISAHSFSEKINRCFGESFGTGGQTIFD